MKSKKIAFIDNSEKHIAAFAARFTSTCHRDLAIIKLVKKELPQYSRSRQEDVFNIIRDAIEKEGGITFYKSLDIDGFIEVVDLSRVRPVVWRKRRRNR